jgi:hypothetical protein
MRKTALGGCKLHACVAVMQLCAAPATRRFVVWINQMFDESALERADAAGVIVQPARGLLFSTKRSSAIAKRKPVRTLLSVIKPVAVLAVAQYTARCQP